MAHDEMFLWLQTHAHKSILFNLKANVLLKNANLYFATQSLSRLTLFLSGTLSSSCSLSVPLCIS